MEQALTSTAHMTAGDDYHLVHEWRVGRLIRLGVPWPQAQAAADRVDWHQVATLVQHGCPPQLALRIVG